MLRRPIQETLWHEKISEESWEKIYGIIFGRTSEIEDETTEAELSLVDDNPRTTNKYEQQTLPTIYNLGEQALQIMIDRYGTTDFKDSDIKDLFLLTDYLHEESQDDRLFREYANETWPKVVAIFRDDVARAIYSKMTEDDLDVKACIFRVLPESLLK